MQDRKIICQLITGSNLYGTNRPDSDVDYTGVFMPTRTDLLGIGNAPAEFSDGHKASDGPRNTAGDVDSKYYSLKRFLKLAVEGQPGQLEMLFAPTTHWVRNTDEWVELVHTREVFFSQKSIAPFIGFAIAQAHKATIKGENVNALRAILAWGSKLTPEQRRAPLGAHLELPSGKFDPATWKGGKFEARIIGLVDVNDTFDFEVCENDHGFVTFRVAGRQYDPGTKTATFLDAIQILLDKYGTRSKSAAENGYDFKSLMHAYRLIGEANEFLRTGHITLPRPPTEVEMLKLIRSGELYKGQDFDWHSDLIREADRLRDVVAPASPLPKLPKWGKVDELVERMLWRHLDDMVTLETVERFNTAIASGYEKTKTPLEVEDLQIPEWKRVGKE